MRSLGRRTLLAALALGLGVVLFVVGGIVLGGNEPDPDVQANAVTAGVTPERGTLAAIRARVERVPGDWVAWATLGSSYVEQARVSGDPSFYPRAEDAFDESLRVKPEENAKALTGLAFLAAARHDFPATVEMAQRSLEVNAFDAATYGILTDGLIELGRYDEAERALQQMVDLSPDAAAFSRVSYLRELHGDIDGARSAMERSLEGAPAPTVAAFAAFYLGELAFNAGDLDTAEARYEEALALDPSSVQPVAGLAKVDAARGDTEAAEARYRKVVDALPLPLYAAELGDLLASVGREEEAQEQYAVVQAQIALIEANGGSADLEAALFAADHDDPAKALELAQREYEIRQSIHTDDALAWALHVNGRDAEALPLAERALRLGTPNASFYFHKGMIESALGQTEAARVSLQTALDINPYFSVLRAPVAKAELARLGAQG